MTMAVSGSRLDQITAAAERLFSHQGYHATSIRQIARAVDLQGGSLYAHITSKEDVLAAIVARADEEFQAAVQPILLADDPAPLRLRRAVRAHVTVVAANLAAATVYLQEWQHLSPANRGEVLRRRDEYEACWRQLFVDGMAEGSFRRVDPALAAVAVLSLCNWTYQWFDPAGPLGPSAVADMYSDILLHGLACSPQTEGVPPHP